jgi:lysophospholipid acyltransferase (LPLAT)-like uncharacterized protein
MPDPVSRKAGVVVPKRLSFPRRILAYTAGWLLWGLIHSWRRRWKATAGQADVAAPVIYCVWHSHLALALGCYDMVAAMKWNAKGMAAMVSASGDGAFLETVLARFGLHAVRGSTSRRGPQALLEASRWLRNGYSVAITPDGPRGPARRVQMGIIYLAQVSGRPIIPVSNYARWKVRLNSWDRFQIPLPFSSCDLYDNEPIYVPRSATDEEREQLRVKLEASMLAITRD